MSSKKNYLSDAELEEFIEAVEKEPLLKAPDYLKEQILYNASKKDDGSLQKNFFIFSAKVAAGAAAALALLFFLPNMEHFDWSRRNTAVLYENENSLLEGLNQKTSQFCNFITDTANSIFIKEDD